MRIQHTEIDPKEVQDIKYSERNGFSTRVLVVLSGGRQLNFSALTEAAKNSLVKEYKALLEQVKLKK